MPYFLAQGRNRPMLASVISMLDRAEPSFLRCRKLCLPWWGFILAVCRAARNFFMAACSTWPVSLPVLTANAMVFCSISSCNCYPSLEVKAGRRHGLDTHPQAGKVVGANTYQIPVLSHFHAGGPPSAAYQYIKGFSAVQAAVVVRQVKTDVIVVCLLVKNQSPLFHRAVLLFQILPVFISWATSAV